MGDNYIFETRKSQLRKSLWNILGDTFMRELKLNDLYSDLVKEAEQDLYKSEIGGHEAAQRILRGVLR